MAGVTVFESIHPFAPLIAYSEQDEAMWTLQLSALLVIAISMLWSLLRGFNRWWYLPSLPASAPPLPPGDLGWPIVGNMRQFLFHFKHGNPRDFIGQYIHKYGNIGVYKSFMFLKPSILVTTPEACKLVLMNDDLFVSAWPENVVKLMGHKSFVSLNKEEHQRLRRLTAASINGPQALGKYVPKIDRLAQQTLEECAEKTHVSFLLETKKFTFNVIADIFMTFKPGPKTEAIEIQYRKINLGVRAMPINLPGTAYHTALKGRVCLVALLQDIINDRRKQNLHQDDMLESLMTARDDDGSYLTDEEIIDVMVMYLNAGHESSSHIIMWITIFLMRYPDVLERVKEEQEKISERKKSTNCSLTLQDYRSMKYLSKVIDEVLRVVNISPMVFRKALCDVEFNGHTIPKGWTVQAWLREVHLDDRVYNDAEKFDPDRWDNYGARPGTFVPFGAGSRLCPGSELAKLEVSIFMHHLISNYRLEAVNLDCQVTHLPHPHPIDGFEARVYRSHSSAMKMECAGPPLSHEIPDPA